MKNKLLLIIILLNFSVSAQSFNEVLEFWDNGYKKNEVIKNLDLEVIKENEYNILGNLISTKNYDPSTQKLDGEFFNEDFKGTYDQGKLNCNNCKLYLNSDSPEILYSGNVVNGFLDGKYTITTNKETYSSRKWTSEERLNFVYNLGSEEAQLFLMVNPSYSYKSGNKSVKIADIEFKKGSLFNKQTFYNSYGEKMSELIFDTNGRIKSFVSYNEENTSISKDSIVRDSKIWKVDNRYIKSNFIQILNKTIEIFKDRYKEIFELINSFNLESYGIIEQYDIVKESNMFLINSGTKKRILENKRKRELENKRKRERELEYELNRQLPKLVYSISKTNFSWQEYRIEDVDSLTYEKNRRCYIDIYVWYKGETTPVKLSVARKLAVCE
jgi:hypothetical protein